MQHAEALFLTGAAMLGTAGGWLLHWRLAPSRVLAAAVVFGAVLAAGLPGMAAAQGGWPGAGALGAGLLAGALAQRWLESLLTTWCHP